jgi:DNA-directed RNA polymerase specialized sigma24 family protein
LSELVAQFSGYVYAIVGCVALNSDRAQGAYRDVFTRVYPRVDALADPGAVKRWIAQPARHIAADSLRLDARELPSEASTFGLAGEPDLTEIELAMVVPEAPGLPPGTVSSRISRGLVIRRRALEDQARPAAGGDIDA